MFTRPGNETVSSTQLLAMAQATDGDLESQWHSRGRDLLDPRRPGVAGNIPWLKRPYSYGPKYQL